MSKLVIKSNQDATAHAVFERLAFKWELSIIGPRGGEYGWMRCDVEELVKLRDWVDEALQAFGVD